MILFAFLGSIAFVLLTSLYLWWAVGTLVAPWPRLSSSKVHQHKPWTNSPEPPKFKPPLDLNREDQMWLARHLELAGRAHPGWAVAIDGTVCATHEVPALLADRYPPPKVSLVNSYRKPSSGEYIEITCASDKRRMYVATGRN